MGGLPRRGFVERLSPTPPGWEVVETVGRVQELHADSLALRATSGSVLEEPLGLVEGPGSLVVALRRATAPAVVLGRAQREELVDAPRAAREGLDVAHRTSGGGAVLVVPGEMCWVDVIVDRAEAAWANDVNHALVVVGTAWREALIDLGFASDRVQLARGAVGEQALAKVACFAGVGTGEVLLDGAKVVGLCQRRGRRFTLVQGAAIATHDPGRLVRVLSLPELERSRLLAALERCAAGLGAEVASLEASRALARRIAAHLPADS